MAFLASCQEITKAFGARTLFRGITIGIAEGERAGLIGPNGSGKSTLVKILAGKEKPDAGTVSTRRQLRIGYVPQQDEFPCGATVREVLLEPLGGSSLMEHEREDRVAALAAELGFERLDQEVATLSGGWRKRLAIGRELMRDPELLLLDEPTNHLDLEGILWLERLLQKAPFAFVLVSHDRYFLQNVTNRTVELNPAYAEGYLSVNGPYADFLIRREEYLAAQAHHQVALASKVRREIEWLRRGARARSTKEGARIRQAGQLMEELAEVRHRNTQDRTAGIDFDATGRKTRELLTGKGLTKSLGGRLLFKDLDITLSPGMRLGLVGPNGSGKSTLIRVLTGEVPPDAGSLRPADGLRVVLFDQNREQLDLSESLRRSLSPTGDTVIYRDRPMHVAAWAKRFLFHTDQLEMSIGYLSGGEQARILIARLMLQPADVLILDEPTNDLDIPTLEVLEDSLAEFPGAILLVTHDRFMLDSVSTEILGLDGRGGGRYFADYSQWERFRDEAAQAERARTAPAQSAARSAAPAPRFTMAQQRELNKVEAKIEAAEAEVASLERRLTEPDVATDNARLQQCWADLQAARERVAEFYARWEELETLKSEGR